MLGYGKQVIVLVLSLLFCLGPVAAVGNGVDVLDDCKFGLNITYLGANFVPNEEYEYKLYLYRKDNEFAGKLARFTIPLLLEDGTVYNFTKTLLMEDQAYTTTLRFKKPIVLKNYTNYGIQFPGWFHGFTDDIADTVYTLRLKPDIIDHGNIDYEFGRQDHKYNKYYVKIHRVITLYKWFCSSGEEFEFDVGMDEGKSWSQGEIDTGCLSYNSFYAPDRSYGLQFKEVK